MNIHVEQLSFSYRLVPVLRNVNATASAGRITAVIGPNAAGKSTLLRCIIGALRPQHGRVMVDEQNIRNLSAREVAQFIGYVPQRSIVSAAFTVRQVVELGRYAIEPNPAAIDRALQRLDLHDVEHRPYPQLSVGQQQRVTLARAIAQLNVSGCLVLDEPMSAMDLEHIASSVRLLRELAAGGATILLATHDLTFAAALADDVWLLHQGQMAACGPSRDVLLVERLEQVFRTPFQWIQTNAGDRRLLPLTVQPRSTQPATIEPT